MLWVPCSRVGSAPAPAPILEHAPGLAPSSGQVGHIYRAMVPYDFGDLAAGAKGGDVINTNHRRVVETWMDQHYREHFYTRVPLARHLSTSP